MDVNIHFQRQVKLWLVAPFFNAISITKKNNFFCRKIKRKSQDQISRHWLSSFIRQILLSYYLRMIYRFAQNSFFWISKSNRHVTGIFKKRELEIDSPAGPAMIGAEMKMSVSSLTSCWKMHFPKPGKYSTIYIYHIHTFLPSQPQPC